MGKGRLEAFSDGVIAILITIMVLELRPPHVAGFEGLLPLVPKLLSYLLSFVFLGIYWNAHHHLLHTLHHVNGRIMWANLHLLFWLSLIPFGTAWMGDAFESVPAAVYGVVLFLAAIGYTILQREIVLQQGPGSALAAAVGRDVKAKISTGLYASAIPLAFVHPSISAAIYVLVALIWIVPDRRIESQLGRHDSA